MKTYTVEEAQQCLGNLIDLVLQGEQITIVKDSKFMVLEERLFNEPMPVAPPGYFDKVYDEATIREDNLFAEHSVKNLDP